MTIFKIMKLNQGGRLFRPLLSGSISTPFLSRSNSSKCSSSSTSDLNTDINIHGHKLNRPVPKLDKQSKLNLKKAAQGSLIPETLQAMKTDADFIKASAELKKFGQKALTKAERIKRQRALDTLGIPEFRTFLKKQSSEKENQISLDRKPTEILQLNVGIYCNQACSHCHVESSPKRNEMMSREVAEKCIEFLANSPSIHTLDITGGAPELCTQFRYLVEESTKLKKTVIDRCNLTALLEPGQESTAEFLKSNKVVIIASLPCYSAKNVNLQRGKGVFQKSIQALLDLNALGYGMQNSDLKLHLVYNPLGAFLPPDQQKLEIKYKEELWEEFGIEFNELYTITNMPIKRFADFLYRRGELESYMDLLVRNFNSKTVDNIMCRNLISVSYDGSVYDCDFNQQLAIPLERSLNISQIKSSQDLLNLKITTDNHCYGCTAGRGSS